MPQLLLHTLNLAYSIQLEMQTLKLNPEKGVELSTTQNNVKVYFNHQLNMHEF